MKDNSMSPESNSLERPQNANGMERRRFLRYLAAAPFAYGVIAPSLVSAATQSVQNGKPVVLITGSSSGFGFVTAKKLARNGFIVVASMRNVAGKNAAAAAELRKLAVDEKLRLHVVEIDVDSDESVTKGVKNAMAIAGRIDVLFNNAGINIPGPVELSMDAVKQSFETNVFGQLRVLRAVAPSMRERQSGLIIQMSSGLGRFVFPTSGLYCGTKFAQEALLESAAYELHPIGVEVAIIQPSDYDTKIKENSRRYFKDLLANLNAEDQERAKAYKQHIEVTWASQEESPAPPPEEVADIVLELANTPAGKRPLRQVAMPPEIAEGTNELNGTLEGVQKDILNSVGLGDWLTLKQT